ncbi:biopolymer transporter ExbD [Spongiimicrobium salis]|uniref:biopolymer transporter ExbD n=1 Tax=Spongiimicrobium salis TaxID=1667022 RepID=UPI00374CA4FE
MKLKLFIGCLFILIFLGCRNDKGIIKELPEISETEIEFDLNNAIKIFIDEKNQLLVDNEKVDMDELKTKVREYAIANKEQSVFSLKNAPESSYGIFVEVQESIVDEIRNLREALSKEKYNITLDSLTKQQLSEIRKVYPQNWIE